MFKKFFILVLIVAIGIAIWVAFALWTGIYSVYSYPPGKDYPSGRTLLVSRAQGEPTFNSPDYVEPKRPPPQQTSGIGFGTVTPHNLPIETRIVAELPYIEWAYKKSLPPETEKDRKKK